MQAYIAISYKKRNDLADVVNAIKDILVQHSIDPFVFIDNYHFNSSQEKEMMNQAFNEIDKADLLIAEVLDKAIGIGVEVGYAKAKNKTVIYLRHADTEHSKTVAGSSDHIIIYKDTSDLKNQLSILFHKIENKKQD